MAVQQRAAADGHVLSNVPNAIPGQSQQALLDSGASRGVDVADDVNGSRLVTAFQD